MITWKIWITVNVSLSACIAFSLETFKFYVFHMFCFFFAVSLHTQLLFLLFGFNSTWNFVYKSNTDLRNWSKMIIYREQFKVLMKISMSFRMLFVSRKNRIGKPTFLWLSLFMDVFLCLLCFSYFSKHQNATSLS